MIIISDEEDTMNMRTVSISKPKSLMKLANFKKS